MCHGDKWALQEWGVTEGGCVMGWLYHGDADVREGGSWRGHIMRGGSGGGVDGSWGCIL